jgi:hypothetical protein
MYHRHRSRHVDVDTDIYLMCYTQAMPRTSVPRNYDETVQ